MGLVWFSWVSSGSNGPVCKSHNEELQRRLGLNLVWPWFGLVCHWFWCLYEMPVCLRSRLWLALVNASATPRFGTWFGLALELVWPWFGLVWPWFALGLDLLWNFGLALVWIWFGLGLAWFGLGLAWFGLGLDLVWTWFGFGLALVWTWCDLGGDEPLGFRRFQRG